MIKILKYFVFFLLSCYFYIIDTFAENITETTFIENAFAKNIIEDDLEKNIENIDDLNILDNLEDLDMNLLDVKQLPLSDSLAKSFPKIKSNYFTISNSKANIILHEKNYKINKEVSLYDISKYYNSFSYDFNNKIKIIKIPKMDEKIYISYYKNKNNCSFLIVLYGKLTEKEVMTDIENISKWLEQFYLYKASRKDDLVASIDVLYGAQNKLDLKIQKNHYLLISKKYKGNITKTIRYRTILDAPIFTDDFIGEIIYTTSIFKSPISKKINSNICIDKSNRFKVLIDSISYLIFGSPFKTILQNTDD